MNNRHGEMTKLAFTDQLYTYQNNVTATYLFNVQKPNIFIACLPTLKENISYFIRTNLSLPWYLYQTVATFK